ncbi:T9SS type A sorting domain-containing protein [Spirosoma endophyticum]|uniref:Por secretion system C-terminal sorting domain-containing protein n=1 Tax=Spirosoma endophyticum TaxID=662367 RepID=A0A1I1PZM7_9BACT|nr:T9SS type A sorting domain-containing protein [Spirosoma endophyticum]SFD15351.1 Por secretion system C-terminal sorting domain-containing protein [Spirosoma endophyticum]
MKKVYTALFLFCLLVAADAIGQTTYFEQDFSTGSVPADYISATPDNTKFNGIGSGATLLVNVVGQALEFDRQADNTTRGYVVRTTDFSPAPSSLYVQFRFQVLSTSKPGANAVKFYVGSGFNVPTPPTNASVYARFALDIQDNTSFQANALPNGGSAPNNPQTFSGWQTITFILNKAGSTLRYLTPLGDLEQQPVDTYDLWVGTTKVFDNQPVLTPSQSVTDFKLGFDDGISKIQVDDFLIRDINGILPVTLLDFTAKPEGDRVQLAWTTAMERNTDRFVVERSRDLGEYVPVGELAAKGNTDERQYYGLTDLNPQPGVNYYRLMQVDNDGSRHAFKPISAIIQVNEPVVAVYPNPSTAVRIHLRLWNAGDAVIQLRTTTGQTISGRLERQAGEADFVVDQPLSCGLYWLDVQTNGQKKVIKVLVP